MSRKIFINIIIFFLATVFSKFSGILKSFFLAKILTPEDFGVWVTLLISTSYVGILTLGTLESLIKLVPFYIGRNEKGEIKKIENNIFTYIIVFIFFVIIVIIFFPKLKSQEIKHLNLIIKIMGIGLITNLFSSFFYFRYVAYQNFKFVSLADSIQTFSALIFELFLTYYFGLFGAVIGFLISELILFLFLSISNLINYGVLKIEFNFSLFYKIIKIGLPITILVWIFILLTTVDRIMVMSFLGKIYAGYYGLGVAISSIIILISQAVAKVLYPKINEEYGKNQDLKELSKYIIRPKIVFSVLIPIIILVTALLLPFIYNVLLPKYKPGLLSAEILLLSLYYNSHLKNATNLLLAINKQKNILLLAIIGLIINVFGNYILIKLGFSINGVAVSTLFSSFLITSIIWIYILILLKYNIKDIIYDLFNMNISFIILFSMIIFYNYLIGFSNINNIFSHILNFFIIFFLYIFIIMLFPIYRNNIIYLLKKITVYIKEKI